MNLPVYHHVHLKTDSTDEIVSRLTPEMNLKNPVAIHLQSFDSDQQREIIGVIENYFDVNNISFKFPYPVYFIGNVESSVTEMGLVRTQEELPKFFSQKEGRMNVKETHLALKNRLLHQEIRNVDSKLMKENIQKYAETHRQIYETDREITFYRSLLAQLKSGKKRGQ